MFSLIIDESTNIQVKSQLGVVALFWSRNDCALIARLFDFVEAESSTAEGLTEILLKCVDKKKVPREMYRFLSLF